MACRAEIGQPHQPEGKMIDTRLILVEGPPGSGKTTTAQNLATEISNSGKACQCFLEWSTDNPIVIGDDLHLGEVVDASIASEAGVLQQWRQLAQARQADDLVTVMESRFWQTSVMLMYAAGHPLESVLESNLRVIKIIQGLKPVLIYIAIDDLRGFTEQMVQMKNEEWQRADLPGSWIQHIYDAFDKQKWFTERGLGGLTGILAFLEEWTLVTERLYNQLPFPKIQVQNPYKDWTLAMRQMRGFLGLTGN
jgi:DNA polymerase III delta prime subunit